MHCLGDIPNVLGHNYKFSENRILKGKGVVYNKRKTVFIGSDIWHKRWDISWKTYVLYWSAEFEFPLNFTRSSHANPHLMRQQVTDQVLGFLSVWKGNIKFRLLTLAWVSSWLLWAFGQIMGGRSLSLFVFLHFKWKKKSIPGLWAGI